MDLELKPLGQVLVIGAFAVYAILYLTRICHVTWMPRFFDQKQAKNHVSDTAVYLAVAFAVGVVLNDVSKSIVAQRNAEGPHAEAEEAFLARVINHCVLDTEKELRFRSLFKVKHHEIYAKSICLELLNLPQPDDTIRPYLETIKASIDSSGRSKIDLTDKDAAEALRAAVNTIYYNAKNRIYREQTYFGELSAISDKLDFTRSLTLVCLSFALLYFVFGGLAYIRPVVDFLKIDVKRRWTIIGLGVLYALFVWVAAFAYRTEAINYDLRVFGYYISLATEPSSGVRSPSAIH